MMIVFDSPNSVENVRVFHNQQFYPRRYRNPNFETNVGTLTGLMLHSPPSSLVKLTNKEVFPTKASEGGVPPLALADLSHPRD